jgi:hypothetical protein
MIVQAALDEARDRLFQRGEFGAGLTGLRQPACVYRPKRAAPRDAPALAFEGHVGDGVHD